MLSDLVKKTTAAVIKSGMFTGSGVIFSWKNKLYCVTAAHNLYGKELNEELNQNELKIEDYLGNSHKVLTVMGEVHVSKEHDIALLFLGETLTPYDYISMVFSARPESKKSTFFLRGYYGEDKNGPVNITEIYYDEPLGTPAFHFFCNVDREKLANNVFSYGGDWLEGLSGSGLFYENKKDVVCAGILLEIPNRGDHGKLKFCGLDILNKLGFEQRILRSRIFELDTDTLDKEWFKLKMDDSIAALGQRYTPKRNFELPIAKLFDGLSRNKSFKDELDGHFEELYQKRRRCYHAFDSKIITTEAGEIDEKLATLKIQFLALDIRGAETIDYDFFIELIRSIADRLAECTGKLYKAQEDAEKRAPTPTYSTKPFASEIHELYELRAALSAFRRMVDSIECHLCNYPYVVMKGEAGMGKSHLIGDIVSKRYDENQYSLLLLGSQFNTADPVWSQILYNLLRVEGDENAFLELLNAKAELSGHRIVIFIDAINEGLGKQIWRNQLKTLIQNIKRHQWLGAVISVRTTYHDFLVDSTIYEERQAESVIHDGFSELEYEAADYFFDDYGIKKPDVPLLHPEFRNPLFLKLFCDGLKAKGLTEIPRGYAGISAVLDFYLNSINEKLSAEFDYHERLRLVRKAILAFATQLASKRKTYMSEEECDIFFNALPELHSLDRLKFIDALVHEGVLSKNMYYKNGEAEEGMYFTYERFFDHLVAANLIDQLGKNPMRVFGRWGRFFQYFRNEQTCYQNSGLIEALSVQIPEKYDLEFFDLVPYASDFRPVAEGFVQSLIWRKTESFEEKTTGTSVKGKILFWWKNIWTGYPKGIKKERVVSYLKNVLTTKPYLFDNFFSNILLITSVPGHMFNADYLHELFLRFSMADRDSKLLSLLSSNYGEGSPVSRLIDWGWKDENRDYLTDESVLLSCTTLSWLLISPNRTLRDSATKALICLLQYKLQLLVPLLKKFETVNDPYVYERLIGVAYGCTLRTIEFSFLADLCSYLFTTIFQKETVYAHLLARDYAKSIVEFARKHGIALDFDVNRTIPPYNSDPITVFPSDTEIQERYSLNTDNNPNAYYQNVILDSMDTGSNYGDFGRYVFSRALDRWDVNHHQLSNYAIERIFEMGYDINKLGEYERNDRYHNGEHNERLGKKYQWIALMEILARVADHSAMYADGDYDMKTPMPFQGAWQPGVRDIDVSLVCRKTLDTESNRWAKDKPWWIDVSNVNFEITNREWMQREQDIPKIENLLPVTDANGDHWISLELIFDMNEDKKLGEDRFDGPTKRIFLQIRSYLVKTEDFEEFRVWCESVDYSEQWMPDSPTKHDLFSREYYWSEAYQYNQQSYRGGNGDEELHDRLTGNFIADVHVPVEYFTWGAEFDMSKEHSISFYRPSEKLWRGLQMKFAHLEGIYIDSKGDVIAMDPSVNLPGPSCLLIKKKNFLDFLAANKLRMCWTVFGQKQILSNKHLNTDEHPNFSHKINGFYWLEVDQLRGSIHSDIEAF